MLVIDDLRHASYRPLPGAARLEQADVADAAARAAIEAWKPSAILHLAAQGGVNRSWREPAIDAHINVLGTVSMLVASIAAGCRRVVVASSGGALYGASQRLPTPEDEPAQPRSPYGAAKLCIEHYLGHFTRSRRARRPGASLRERLRTRSGRHRRGGRGGDLQPPPARGQSPGHPGRRGPDARLHLRGRHRCRERARADLDRDRCLEHRHRPRDRHRRSGRAACARSPAIRANPEREPLPPGEVARSALDNSLAADRLGWIPRVRLDDGLARTLESFREPGPVIRPRRGRP